VTIKARALTPGHASGTILKLDVSLSFWGGVDLHSSEIIDRSHPDCGKRIAGRVLLMPSARGSSSSSSALVELARSGMAPLAIVMLQHDPILVIGALVAAELYAIDIPVVILAEADWPTLHDDDNISLRVVGDRAQIALA
jgi:predicted aconitase with swiveling domain